MSSALVLVLVVGSDLACTDRSSSDDDMGSEDGSGDGPPAGDPGDPGDPGDQPAEPGVMYSACVQSSECAPQEFCVFPQGESGFCTSACLAPTDPSGCDPPPGDQGSTCFDIGLVDGRWVCALDCASSPCPRGMRCESVAAAGGERSICF
ncbi:MAG: hypothetical protein KDK70_27380 [Myxococcales bacterium]|nr:hypothetical protein [Myxococcales bacterium]